MRDELGYLLKWTQRSYLGLTRKGNGVCRASEGRRGDKDDWFQLVVGKGKGTQRSQSVVINALRRQLLRRKHTEMEKPNSKWRVL